MRLIALMAVAVAWSCQSGEYEDGTGGSESRPEFRLELGVREDGTATPLWTEGVAVAIGREAADRIAQERRPLTPAAQAWLDVLRDAVPIVANRAPELAAPFGLPALDATVAAGDRGSSDGFGWGGTYIGINVEAFGEAYGPPEDGALDRMVRIVSHEYVHLLTYAYYPNHRDLCNTSFNRALWTIFHEGLGDYFSMSNRWLPDEDGTYPPVTARTLARLEPIFVERLEALATATPDEEAELREKISMGRFDEKWGSLPLALWLRSEAVRCGERETLEWMIRSGPHGVLPLARRHAAPDLRPRINALLEIAQRGPAGCRR